MLEKHKRLPVQSDMYACYPCLRSEWLTVYLPDVGRLTVSAFSAGITLVTSWREQSCDVCFLLHRSDQFGACFRVAE